MPWTSEQILSLAPDAASAKAGRGLATKSKWPTLARFGEELLWGECQGSGSTPYRTQIDLSEPAFKCSCPSRKFPCKHSLGLFILFADQPSSFSETDPPAWVADWMASRSERAEKKAKKKEEQADKPVDTKAQAKRAAERERKVAAGMEELERWLGDIVRQGLVATQGRAHTFWETTAARLVDAQAPGAARRVRELAALPFIGDGWQGELLRELSRLHLLVEAYKRVDSLPDDLAAEVRSQVGFTMAQEEVLALAGVRDEWLVAGRTVEEDAQMRVQRTWLWGTTTGRAALVLAFAHRAASGSGGFDASLAPGMLLDAELSFFPGSYPLRALVRERGSSSVASAPTCGHDEFISASRSWSEAIASNPWLDRAPALVRGLTPIVDSKRVWLRDRNGTMIEALDQNTDRLWKLIALAASAPVDIFAEYHVDRRTLQPLTVWSADRIVPL